MKTIITTLLFLSLTACELKDVNEESPVVNYVKPDFVVPKQMLGEYVNADHNFNKGTVSITPTVITIATITYSVTVPINNDMYYNGCYISIKLPDGVIMQVWHYKGHDFVNVRLIDEGVEYPLGRYVPVKPEEPTGPILN